MNELKDEKEELERENQDLLRQSQGLGESNNALKENLIVAEKKLREKQAKLKASMERLKKSKRKEARENRMLSDLVNSAGQKRSPSFRGQTREASPYYSGILGEINNMIDSGRGSLRGSKVASPLTARELSAHSRMGKR